MRILLNKKNFLFLGSLIFAQSMHAFVYNNVAPNTTNFAAASNIVQTAARGFVFFNSGIIFDGTVDVSLAAPIMGNVQFGYGTNCLINLETDLMLGSTAGTSSTKINVNTPTGSVDINGNGGTIIFGGDTFLPDSRAFNVLSNLTIDGAGYDIIFGRSMTFTVQSGVALTIRNARLRNLQTLNFVGAGTVALCNVEVILDNDWTFSGNESIGTPQLNFHGTSRVFGKNKKFIYSGGRNMALSSDSLLMFEPTVTFSWASQRRYGLAMDDIQNTVPYTDSVPGSILYFDNSNLFIPTHGSFGGLNLKKGSIFFENKCNIYNESNTGASRSLQFGDGLSSSNNTDLLIMSGAQVYVDGYVYDASV
jgi:hypothetical protein